MKDEACFPKKQVYVSMSAPRKTPRSPLMVLHVWVDEQPEKSIQPLGR